MFVIYVLYFFFLFFFFKQKTAYEMRISDWSSDVCSSDLAEDVGDDARQTADDQPFGIDQQPFLFDLVRLGRHCGLHERLHGFPDLIWCETRNAAPKGSADGGLMIDDPAQVKQNRAFLIGYYNPSADRKSTRLNSSH